MLSRTAVIILLSLFAPCATALPALTLKEAMRLALENATELTPFHHQKAALEARTAAIAGAYDPKLNYSSRWSVDQTPSQTFTRDRASVLGQDFSAQKLFSTGTSVKLGLHHRRTKMDFPPPTQVETASGVNIPFDINANFAKNPEYFTRISVDVVQALWRNWLGQEIKLKEQIAGSATSQPRFEREIIAQQVQNEVERLFLQLSEVEHKMLLISKSIKLSQLYHKYMRRKVDFGHADPIHATVAKASIVQFEGQLLRLQLARKTIAQRLELRVFGRRGHPARWILPPAKRPHLGVVLAKPSSKSSDALVSKRIDIAQLEEARAPLNLQLALIREQERFELNGIFSANSSALEGDFAGSFPSPDKNPSFALSVQISIPLDKTDTRYEREALYQELEVIERRKESILRRVGNELLLSAEEFADARAIRRQAGGHIEVLEQQIKLERERIRQARSDETAVVKYQLEIEQIRMLILEAFLRERFVEAKQRLLSHSYPREAAS